jgi:queuine tRNA-ribosyltransferase
MPTRNGRNALAFTDDGPVRLRNAKHRRDPAPLMSGCACYCCANYSRAYLHHLFQAAEMLGPTLVSLHNLAYYLGLMAEVRRQVAAGTFGAYRARMRGRWRAAPYNSSSDRAEVSAEE